jgi:hypothetical protein
MMVAAVAIMGSFLLTLSNSNFAIQRGQIANATDSKVNQIRESFVIEDVWFNTVTSPPPTTKYANVTLRNTGDVAVRISNIYINNTQVWNTGQIMAADSVIEIRVQTNWGSNDAQSIWVKSQRGTEVKQVWRS